MGGRRPLALSFAHFLYVRQQCLKEKSCASPEKGRRAAFPHAPQQNLALCFSPQQILEIFKEPTQNKTRLTGQNHILLENITNKDCFQLRTPLNAKQLVSRREVRAQISTFLSQHLAQATANGYTQNQQIFSLIQYSCFYVLSES